MLTAADMPAGYVLVTSAADEVEIEDAGNPTLGIGGDLKAGGVLVFVIQAEDEIDGSRGAVEGEVLFGLMMRHFGNRVSSIHSLWTYGTNLAAFNRGVLAGLSMEAAAADTWTGRRAADHGFRVVANVFAVGMVGYYGWVEADFHRPASVP